MLNTDTAASAIKARKTASGIRLLLKFFVRILVSTAPTDACFRSELVLASEGTEVVGFRPAKGSVEFMDLTVSNVH